MNLILQNSGLRRGALYVVNLLVSFHYFIVIYINSAFLSKYISTETISVLYLVGSVASVFLFILFPKLLSILGNFWLSIFLTFLEIVALVGLAVADPVQMIVVAFILYLILSPVIYLNLDIFLEKFTQSEKTTGGVRGLFLTMQNITQVSAPLLVGMILVNNEYWKVYVSSVFFLCAALILIGLMFRKFNDPRYVNHTVVGSFVYVVKNAELNKVFCAQLLLRFFYAWMVIYTPLYLHEYIGFSWSQIGTIFSVMLLPFLLLELPLGKILDSKSIEKFTMTGGFLILFATVVTIPVISGSTLWVWAAVLFCSRVGAACVEMTSESYFFRHVDGRFADTISLFRMTRPVTYVLAAAVASITLQVMSLQHSFYVLAVLLLFGIPFAMSLVTSR